MIDVDFILKSEEGGGEQNKNKSVEGTFSVCREFLGNPFILESVGTHEND